MLCEVFQSKLLPAVILSSIDSANLVAEAYLEAGLNVMEVALRTKIAIPAITTIVKKFPEMKVGAGTILSLKQLSAAREAGAQFGLAPGFNQTIASKAKELEFPFVPGVMSPSEIEKALNCGFKVLKLFPVNQIGGADYIKKIEGPYLHTGLQFIPMGGVNEKSLDSFINCKSVIAAGGSWLSPKRMIEKKQFEKITDIVSRSIEIIENGK